MSGASLRSRRNTSAEAHRRLRSVQPAVVIRNQSNLLSVALELDRVCSKIVAMLDTIFAEFFARDWIESWNAHDLNRILAHYTDDFEMTSPLIAQLMGGSGCLKGRAAVGTYWAKALERVPDLEFSLLATFIGVDSIVLYYETSLGKRATEIFFFDEGRLVYRAAAHYA